MEGYAYGEVICKLRQDYPLRETTCGNHGKEKVLSGAALWSMLAGAVNFAFPIMVSFRLQARGDVVIWL